MPIKLTITSTKPEGATFFGDVSPENFEIVQQYKARVQALPGFVSNDWVQVDANTIVQNIVFDTIENYSVYLEHQKSDETWKTRATYNTENGITGVRVESYVE